VLSVPVVLLRRAIIGEHLGGVGAVVDMWDYFVGFVLDTLFY